MKQKLTIKNLGINGEGIGYINRKICFVEKALPLEEVEVEPYIHERKYIKAKLVKILKQSSMRQKPICPLYDKCQGCSFQHMIYEETLRYKRELVKETFDKYTNINLKVKPVHALNPYHYIQSIAFSVHQLKGELRIGLFQRETKYFSTMDQCELQNQSLTKRLKEIEFLLNKYHIQEYNDKTKKGLRFIIVKQVEKNIQIVFVTGNDGIDKDFTKELSKNKHVVSIYYTVNTARYQEFNEQGYKLIYGEKTLKYSYNDHQYAFSVKTDILKHPELEIQKLETLKRMIDSDNDVLSLYSGNGFIECELPQTITAIDEYEWNIQDSMNNAKENLLLNKLFIKAKIEREIVHQCKKYKFDTMVIHLNKDQLEDIVLESIERSKMKEVILISENISSVVKSIHELEYDYQVVDHELFDIPQTKSISSIFKLVRK